MAIFKDKTGRGEVDYAKSPVQSADGAILFLNDHTALTDNIFAKENANHLVFQLRGKTTGTEDISDNKFSVTESSALTKRQEFVTHTQKLKTFEFTSGKTVTLSPQIQPASLRIALNRPGMSADGNTSPSILPYGQTMGTPFKAGTGRHLITLSFWMYVEDYGTGTDGGGSCIMETVSGTSRTFGIILSSTGELSVRFYDWGANSTAAVEFQELKTVNKISKKTWTHVTVFFTGFGSSVTNLQYNSNGLDEPHQNYSSSGSPAYSSSDFLPQVQIYLNATKQTQVSESGKTSGTFAGTLGTGDNLPLVIGTGLAGYDNGTPQFQSGADANFNGRLAEISYFYTVFIGNDTGITKFQIVSSGYRDTVAKALMTGNRQPTSGITNVSERLLLRDADQNSTHPTVKRSGDQRRLGNHAVKFDDSRAQTLKGATIQYPTKLVEGDNLIDTIYGGYFNGNLTLHHTASVESYDTFYRRNDQPLHSPFVENRIYIDETASFYLTGTLDSVIPGFDTPLKNKEVVEFSLGNAVIGITDFAGNSPSTGSVKSNELNLLDATVHVPSMFYYDNVQKAFEPLSTPDGNLGGIKNASNSSVVTAQSGTIEAQVKAVVEELRLGFSPFEGQPLLFSEQDTSPPSGVSYSQGSDINNMKDGILPQHTASFTQMPVNGNIMGFFQSIDSDGDGSSPHTITFDNSTTTHTSFTSSGATIGLSGLNLATLIPKISTLIGSLTSTTVSSHTTSDPYTIKFHGTSASATLRNYTINETTNTYSNWSFSSVIRGVTEVSCLEYVGEGANENIAGPITDFGFPYSSKYNQEDGKCIKLSDYITEPFLAEKIVVSFNAEASTGFSQSSKYYVYTNEAPTKYVPYYITPVAGSSNTAESHITTYPPPASQSSFISDFAQGQLNPPASIIQYSIDSSAEGEYYMDTQAGQAGLNSLSAFSDYHFFILKQDKKNRSSMEEQRKGSSQIVAYDQSVSQASFAEGLPANRVTDSDITNRELLHHSKILVFTAAQGYSGLVDDRYEERQQVILQNTTGSFDALLAVPGGLDQSVQNRHSPSSNFTPLFDLPYTGSSSPFGDSSTYESFLENQAATNVTSSVRIEKPFNVQKKSTHTANLFLAAHPTDAGQSKSNFSPGSMLRLSNTLGGYQQTEEFGTRAYGPGNISALDGNSKSYATVNSFNVAGNAITSSIAVGTAEDPGAVPTLLLPSDNLIFGWQNAINAAALLAPYKNYKGVTTTDKSSVHTGLELRQEYRVIEYPKLKVKNLKVQIFGSYLRNSQPRQSELNQLLSNDIVHESIGSEAIHDQFDIAPRGAFTGSYADEVMSGSTVSPYNGFNSSIHAHAAGSPPATDFTNLARRVNSRSSEGTHGVTGSLRRNVSFASANKTEYDSFLFDLKGMFNVDERSQNVPDNGKFGFPGNYIDDFETGSNKVDTLLLGSDPSLIGNVADFNTNVTPNVDLGASFLNARYSSVTKVRQPQIGAGANLFNIAATGSYNVPGLIERIEGNANFTGSRFIDDGGDPHTTNFNSTRTSKIIFGIGDGVQNAHRMNAPTRIVFKDVIRGFRYGLSNIADKKPRNVFRRDRYGQLRDMLEMAPNTAYIDDVSNTISYPVEARFFADDGSINNPADTNASNLSTHCTSSAPFFDREEEDYTDTLVIRNRGPLNNQVTDLSIEF